ncbi:MAG: methionyl-tRNA formyltransferase [Eubacteriaceae bacterium]|nr:methionyl-tRNA formyltransferase [Eubacteriaceae bacterium]
MKIVYMGTGEFAVPPLKALMEAGHEILCAVCPEDKPNSRGNKIIPCAVKIFAEESGIEVYQPHRASSAESFGYLSAKGADILIVCSYGQILRKNILTMCPCGALNIHSSLLPRYRGAAPMQRAVMNGESRTGVTVMYMDEGMDTGDIMYASGIDISPEDTFGTVSGKLSEAGASLIVSALEHLQAGDAPRIKQDVAEATYADKITKEETKIDFGRDAETVANTIRGLDPDPGARSVFAGKTVKLYAAVSLGDVTSGSPGEIIGKKDNGIIVRCGENAVLIKKVKPEGKNLMGAIDFYNGIRDRKGAAFS